MSGCHNCWETPCSCYEDDDCYEELGFVYTTIELEKPEESLVEE